MIRILLTGMLALGLAGCHHGSGSVTVETGGHHSHDHNCGHYWDGGSWLIVQRHAHGTNCGHYFHHSQWHARPEHHIYVDSSHGHFGVTIEKRHERDSTPSAPPRAHDEKPQPKHGSPPKPEPHHPKKPK